MTLIALAILTFLVGWSFSFPTDYPFSAVSSDFGSYCGPYTTDYCRRGLGLGLGLGFGLGGLSGIGTLPGTTYGSFLGSDSLDLSGVSADLFGRYPGDYLYPGYPRTVDYAKENFVRGSPYGTTEVGIRDEVTIRSPGPRPFNNRYYCNNYPFNILSYCRSPYYGRLPTSLPIDIDSTYGNPFPFGLGVGASASLIGNVGGDSLLLRR